MIVERDRASIHSETVDSEMDSVGDQDVLSSKTLVVVVQVREHEKRWSTRQAVVDAAESSLGHLC